MISPHVLPYFEGLVDHGFDVTVLFFARSASTRRWNTSITGRYKWEVLPGIRWEIPMEEHIALQFNPSVVWRILSGRFDVVVLFAGYDSPTLWLASLASRLAGIPTVLRCGSVPGRSAYGGCGGGLAVIRRSLSRALVKRIVRSASAWVSYGTRSKRYLIELGAIPERVYPLWNTVDVDRLSQCREDLSSRRDELRRKHGFAPGDVVFLFVGRFLPFKRVDSLLSAYRIVVDELPQAKLAMAGYGPSEAGLRAASSDLTGIRWLGAISQDDIGECYIAADIMVLPSSDIWGLVVNEAMVFGLPVIAADTVGCTDDLVINDVTGFVYPSEVSLLAHYMAQLVKSAELRQRMGQAARDHIRNYTYAKAIGGLINAINNAAGNPETEPTGVRARAHVSK